MTLEIRPARHEEMDAFNRVPSIVFGNYTGKPSDPSQTGGLLPEWTVGAFEDGQLATTYGAYPFTIRLNGEPARVAGVTFVGTLPWFRRRGHLRKIMEYDFQRRYEQQMEPIAILLASIAAIYQRYGYAVVSSRQRYRIDPKTIAFAPTAPCAEGAWREASIEELPLLKQIYREFATPRNLYIHRGAPMWQGGVLGRGPAAFSDGVGPSLLAVYEEGGQPKGYLAYAAKSFESHPDGAGSGQRLFVRDSAWLTPSAYRAIWDHLRTFDLAVRVQMFAPNDDPAFDLMLDPRELNATRFDWILGRIIDVERALPLRPYGAEGRVTFELRDEMCAWNRDRWALDAGPEGARVTRTNESPQLTLDVSALAMLLCGAVSATNLVRYGRAEASVDAPLDLWDRMWRTAYAPHCPDGF